MTEVRKTEVNVSGFKIKRTIGRILALSAFLYVNIWILFVSPFSFFGGSLYGGFMQIILVVPIGVLLMASWDSSQVISLYVVAGVSAAMFPLCFSFPTLFSNAFFMATSGSTAMGGQAISNINVINPSSYYRSSIIKAGNIERKIGPNYEQISNDVIGVNVDIEGRLCDGKNNIFASVNILNEAKYKLSDVLVHLSSVFPNICGLIVDTAKDEDKWLSVYFKRIDDIPKASPVSLSIPLTTNLPGDIITQMCKLRTDVILNYHSTTVFPLSVVNYDDYKLNPSEYDLGTPVSTTSFGKIKLDLTVGKQAIPIITEGSSNNEVLLKLGWSPIENSIVNSPWLYLFFPKDLGVCISKNISEYINESKGSGTANLLGFDIFDNYKGLLYNVDKYRLKKPDFECYKYDGNLTDETAIMEFCKLHYGSSEDVEEIENDPYAVLTKLNNLSSQESMNVPGNKGVCEDLVKKGYSLCKSTFKPTANDELLCTLNLSNVDVNDVYMNTYLIRADSIYQFFDTTMTTFKVDNCDQI